ncbi:hypothetical protein CBM2585_B50150 [Cupriavidus taiwanensis]|nr:hypothetical protein CBM2585_B50150 [Cupriavidus taiwanensis]
MPPGRCHWPACLHASTDSPSIQCPRRHAVATPHTASVRSRPSLGPFANRAWRLPFASRLAFVLSYPPGTNALHNGVPPIFGSCVDHA